MKNYICLLLTVIFMGCASTSVFKDLRNYDVGRKVDLAYLPPPDKIISISSSQDKYLYRENDECSFFYIVNKQSKIVESWDYISSPDKCKKGLNWTGPW